MSRLARFLGVVLAGALFLGAGRAEQTASPAPPDGLATAKSEFEAIKDARAGQAQPALVLPSIPVLELKSADVAPPRTPANGVKDAKAATANSPASPNWLVDAMTDSARQATALAKDSRSAATANDRATLARGDFIENAQRLDAERMRVSRSEKADAPLDHGKAGIPNPLSTFMASWMTAKDFKLLAPTAANERQAAVSPAAGVDSPQAAGEIPGIESPAPFGEGMPTPFPAASANPYLAVMVEPVVVPNGAAIHWDTTAIPPPAAAPPVPASAVAAPLDTPHKPGLDEFLKTQNDQKYFKPLKRF